MTSEPPRWSRQSVNPPVDAPISRQIFPVTAIFQCSRTRSDFSPPRVTHLRFSPGGAVTHYPRPRSREAASPRSTSSLSILTFKKLFCPRGPPRKCQHSLQCKVLKHLSVDHLRRYFAPFPQYFPRTC